MRRLIVAVAGVFLWMAGPACADACMEWKRAVSAMKLAGESLEDAAGGARWGAAYALFGSALHGVRVAERKLAAETPDKMIREALMALVRLEYAARGARNAVVMWGNSRSNASPIVELFNQAQDKIRQARVLALKRVCP